MADWDINFISHEDFKNHVKATIRHYGSKLKPYDVKKFNSNIVDPVKMVFDRAVYGESWGQIISNEIFRQRDKSNTNEISYFHQRLFEYVKNCHVPANGQEGGWDVIYEDSNGYTVDEGNTVHKIYVEMKNKHNTMNSASAGKTYIKMQNQLLSNDDCACFLVEAIAKKSQNIVWETTVNGVKVSHRKIRRVSIDKFYEIVTGQSDAFYQICMVLPKVVDEVLNEERTISERTHDTVYAELEKYSESMQGVPDNQMMIMSMYMLGFSTYLGFKDYNINEER